ncbi:hypothetical protein FQZ97_889810 [compost metagenome]
MITHTRNLGTQWRRATSLLPGVALAVLVALRPWMEATMGRHMGLELPLLFLIGCWGGSAMGAHRLESWNAHGLPGLLFAQCVLAFWMVPAALDVAILSAPMAMAKVASLVAAGAVAYLSWRTAGPVIQAFFVLYGIWMTFTVGMLYQTASIQLCSVYLADEQAAAGRATVFWAALALIGWLAGLIRVAVTAEGAENKASHTWRSSNSDTANFNGRISL